MAPQERKINYLFCSIDKVKKLFYKTIIIKEKLKTGKKDKLSKLPFFSCKVKNKCTTLINKSRKHIQLCIIQWFLVHNYRQKCKDIISEKKINVPQW